MACLLIALTTAVLPACSTNEVQQPAVTPARLSSNPDSMLKGSVMTWGGNIVSVKNLADRTILEILAYPLSSSGEPATGHASIGRFLADRQGYLESREYKAGSRVTVKGPLLGFKDGKVDEAFYRYPALNAQELILWPEQRKHRSRMNFGIGVGSHGRSGMSIGVGF